MVKSKSKLLAGEAYVEISTLPYGQSSLFYGWLLKENIFSKINNPGEGFFVKYEVYEQWFESCYKDLLLEHFDV